jgi:hypothetical protein
MRNLIIILIIWSILLISMFIITMIFVRIFLFFSFGWVDLQFPELI